jgi:hypothetical protein
VRDGVLVAGSSKRKGRWVAKPFVADITLLKTMYGQTEEQQEYQSETTKQTQVKSKPEEIEANAELIDLTGNDGVYEYQDKKPQQHIA